MKNELHLKLPAADLKLGMHVVELDRPWLETDFLIQGFIVQDQQEIDAFIRQCDYVYIAGKSIPKAQESERRKDKRGLFSRRPKDTSKQQPSNQKIDCFVQYHQRWEIYFFLTFP